MQSGIRKPSRKRNRIGFSKDFFPLALALGESCFTASGVLWTASAAVVMRDCAPASFAWHARKFCVQSPGSRKNGKSVNWESTEKRKKKEERKIFLTERFLWKYFISELLQPSSIELCWRALRSHGRSVMKTEKSAARSGRPPPPPRAAGSAPPPPPPRDAAAWLQRAGSATRAATDNRADFKTCILMNRISHSPLGPV